MRRAIAIASLAIASLGIPAAAQRADSVIALPTRYDAGRFYVRPVTERGDTLNLFTDSGGGLWLDTDVVRTLGLATEVADVRGADTLRVARFPPFRSGASIPEPLGFGGKLRVISAARLGGDFARGWSGMLGQEWFSGRVWTFDYPARQLLLHTAAAPVGDPAHTVSLGFKASGGRRQLDFPRIRVEIDGDTLDLLFDTGATATLPPAALAAVADGAPAVRATSFITTTIFDRWRTRHPDWRVIPGADQLPGMAMIEVPHISVAGYTVGPVWFTQRPDRNFHEYMSQFMDRRIEGALGGSALHYFRVTVDYPHATAAFERR